MKKHGMFFFNFVLFFAISFLFNGLLLAQIEITSNDWPSEHGTTIVMESNKAKTVYLDPGLPGENQTWVLDQTYSGVLVPINVVDKNSTPFADKFPEANLAYQFEGSLNGFIPNIDLGDLSGQINIYQKLTPDSLFIQGLAVKLSEFEQDNFISNLAGSIDIKPDMLVMPLPLNYGDNWESNSTYSGQIDTTIMGIPVTLKVALTDSTTHLVDGWGTITLPSGSYECLRVKTYITLVEKIFINDFPYQNRTTYSVNYTWLAPQYGLIAQTLGNPTRNREHLVDQFTRAKLVSRMNEFIPPAPGLAGQQKNPSHEQFGASATLASSYQLFQNHPNPFNPETHISFQLAEPATVKLTVFDIQGSTVRTLVNSARSAGQHSVIWNSRDEMGNPVAAGTYFYRIEVFSPTSSVFEVKKMILMK